MLTYENLSKIITRHDRGSDEQAMRLPEEFENDADALLGGGTCFSLTWYLYQRLVQNGLHCRLVLGHKRIQKNAHCALILEHEGRSYFMDPGYLIFRALPVPQLPEKQTAFFPLQPNWVELHRSDWELQLITGHLKQKKLRFVFDLPGCDEQTFRSCWQESFRFDMMKFPVLNRLEDGVQYYYQKDRLVIRDSESSHIVTFLPEERVEKLSKIFHLEPSTLEKALRILEKQS